MYEQISSNRRRSAALVAGFVALVVAVGFAVELVLGYGLVGVLVAVAVAVGGTATAYWGSDRIALRMSHAQPADEAEHARLHNLVEGLCIASGLPKPRLYIIDDPAPNAFATGRNPRHAAVAVTTGLLEKLNRVELEGVLAHELSHVKNYDILVSTLAVTLVGVVTLLADFSLRFLWWGGPRHRDDRRGGGGGPTAALAIVGMILLVVAPLVARVMQYAVSRQREFLADVTSVSLTRYPPGLISALEKLRDDRTVVHSASRATAHLWIESPLDAEGPDAAGAAPARPAVGPAVGGSRMASINRLFSTHPPLDERIAALREL